jgi:hypothetical protein
MDPRDRADALLHRAQARGAFVVTPQSAVSPMDAANTQKIPEDVVRGADAVAVDPDATTVLPEEEIRRQVGTHHLDEPAPTTSLDNSGETTQSLDITPTGEVLGPRRPKEPTRAEVEVEELDGLIPTTTQRLKPAELSSRLDDPNKPEVEVEELDGLLPTTTRRMRSKPANPLDG